MQTLYLFSVVIHIGYPVPVAYISCFVKGHAQFYTLRPHLQIQTQCWGKQTLALIDVWVLTQTEVECRKMEVLWLNHLWIIESRPYLFSIWQLHSLFTWVGCFSLVFHTVACSPLVVWQGHQRKLILTYPSFCCRHPSACYSLFPVWPWCLVLGSWINGCDCIRRKGGWKPSRTQRVTKMQFYT